MNKTKIIPFTGANNCGGRCVLRAHVRDEIIEKITTETAEEAEGRIPRIACARGLNYHRTYISDDRLKYPMKRIGKRGEGRFVRISWQEALRILEQEWVRIRDTWGSASRYVMNGTGEKGVLNGSYFVKRLLSLDGGYLGGYNSYSTACVRTITPYLYGAHRTGSSPSTWMDSRLIVLWGHNPIETGFDADYMYWLRKAKEAGIPIVGIDPRRNDTFKALEADWYPVRPASDAALADAIAYELYHTGRYDRAFTENVCVGFTKESMPAGIPETECYFSYLSGEQDGIVKTAEWGEEKTGLPASKIRELAERMWNAKPCNILQGWGPQRNGYGEQASRGVIMLQCLMGNVGKRGGSAGGPGNWDTHKRPSMPSVKNPCPVSIPNFLWSSAAEDYSSLDARDGVKGAEKLEVPVKMILSIASNTLINQHSDINRTKQILMDESKVEFIVVSDVFMTASAKFADLLLPCTSFLEEENLMVPWFSGDFLGYNNKVLEPLWECRQEYDWLKEVAEYLGLYEEFTQSHETAADWIADVYSQVRQKESQLCGLDELKKKGMFFYTDTKEIVAFEKECADIRNHPFPTPSGKIEIFSETLYRKTYRDPFPPIPRYMPAPDGYEDVSRADYPLQLVGCHTRRRAHSIHDTNPQLESLDPRAVWMNDKDAADRGLNQGDRVVIYNAHGKVILPVRITEDIMQGVAAMKEGAWYSPDEAGTDLGGCLNVLTDIHPTPLAHGNPQHTNRVEIQKYTETR